MLAERVAAMVAATVNPSAAGSATGAAADRMLAASPEERVQTIPVRAFLLGERLDTRILERDGALATAPLALAISGGGVAVVFRYGAVVLFETPESAAERFLASLESAIGRQVRRR